MLRTALLSLALLGALASAAHADVTLNACAAGKKKCVAARAAAALGCHVTAEKSGADPLADAGIQACFQKASDRFDGGAVPGKACFAKLEAKHPSACLTTGDTASLASLVDVYVDEVVVALDPGYPAPVENACSAAKKKCVRKLASGLLACHVKNGKAKGWEPEPFSQCLSKAHRRFDPQEVPNPGCFAKLEAKYPGACLTVGDTESLRARTVTFVDDTLCALDPGMCPTPTPTPTPPPDFACCQLFSSCADIPGVPASECLMFGGTIVLGQVCQPGGACGAPPIPTPTPTPTSLPDACCQLFSSCADIPGVPASECLMFGGTIVLGQACQPGGACGAPPTPTPTPTP